MRSFSVLLGIWTVPLKLDLGHWAKDRDVGMGGGRAGAERASGRRHE